MGHEKIVIITMELTSIMAIDNSSTFIHKDLERPIADIEATNASQK